MDQLLDFSKDIDTDLLDRIVSVFFSGSATSAEVCIHKNPSLYFFMHTNILFCPIAIRDQKRTQFWSGSRIIQMPGPEHQRSCRIASSRNRNTSRFQFSTKSSTLDGRPCPATKGMVSRTLLLNSAWVGLTMTLFSKHRELYSTRPTSRLFRFLNRSGLPTGPILFPRLLVPREPASTFVKTIWQFWSFYVRKFLISPPNKWPPSKPKLWNVRCVKSF